VLAGLGSGGLAVALAAQRTVESLFGAFSIGADQPFREGDFVRIEDFVGIVEQIGLRSTKVRTLDRTVVTIPNGNLAEMRLETFSARDRIRLACTVGLAKSYDSWRTTSPMFDSHVESYGLGVMVYDLGEADASETDVWLGHSGGFTGESAVVAWSRERRAFVAVALTGAGSAQATALHLLRALDD
jgi:hypothetical protein